MTKRAATNADLSGLRKTVAALPADHRSAAESLLREAAFLQETLTKLKTCVDTDGPIIQTPRTTKENPALKAYNVSIMRYSQLVKQVTDMLPKANPADAPSELQKFLNESRY